MGIALGLAAALCWGLSDCCATVAARRGSVFATVLAVHLLSSAVLIVAVAATGSFGDLRLEHVLVFLANGVLGGGAYLLFYRALALGPISIVSPIVSGYAAVTVLLAVLILGERLVGGQIAAVIIAFVGVALASTDVTNVHRIERSELVGIGIAILSMIFIGVFLFWVAYYADELGWLTPILLGRVFTTLFLLILAARGGFEGLVPRTRLLAAMVVAIATLDTVGYVAFNVGVQREETSVVATAAAPYAIVPIAAGVIFLHERPAVTQWIGVAAVLVGLVLLGLFS
jgi:drug/metabolite transporter (DMT)-like permease